jgi:hemerythrin-like domain-containing protein
LLYSVEDRINQKFKRFTQAFGQDWNDALKDITNDKLAVNVGQYARLLKEHIYKEDNIL